MGLLNLVEKSVPYKDREKQLKYMRDYQQGKFRAQMNERKALFKLRAKFGLEVTFYKTLVNVLLERPDKAEEVKELMNNLPSYAIADEAVIDKRWSEAVDRGEKELDKMLEEEFEKALLYVRKLEQTIMVTPKKKVTQHE